MGDGDVLNQGIELLQGAWCYITSLKETDGEWGEGVCLHLVDGARGADE